jgi:hypothetical protein
VLPHVASQLVGPDGDTRWQAQVAEIGLVPTQSAQLWLRDRCLTSLGWPDDVVASGFSEPFDTFADMPVACRTEGPGMDAETVVYLCGVLFDPVKNRPDSPDYEPTAEDAKRAPDDVERDWLDGEHTWVRNNLVRFLGERAAYLWPRAVDPSTGVFDPATLADPAEVNRKLAQGYETPYAAIEALVREGEALVSEGEEHVNSAAPYFRANVQPADRYVLSLPGTARYRVAPGDSGFGNLFPAGDWTACVLDAGCMEAATISGMLAAEAITGDTRTIIGRQPELAFTFGEDRGDDLYWSTT